MDNEQYFYDKLFGLLKRNKYLRIITYVLVSVSILQSSFAFLSYPASWVTEKAKYYLSIKPEEMEINKYHQAFLAGKNFMGSKDIWINWPPKQEVIPPYNNLRKNFSALGYKQGRVLSALKLDNMDRIQRMLLFWELRSDFEGFLMKSSKCLECYFNLGYELKVLENLLSENEPHPQSMEIYSDSANKIWERIKSKSSFKIYKGNLFFINGEKKNIDNMRKQLKDSYLVIHELLNENT